LLSAGPRGPDASYLGLDFRLGRFAEPAFPGQPLVLAQTGFRYGPLQVAFLHGNIAQDRNEEKGGTVLPDK
jgi:hypothetical protein